MGNSNIFSQVTDTAYGTTIVIKKPTARYLDEFLALKCNMDLLEARLYPNAKEITESMAAFSAVRQHIVRPKMFGDASISVVVVGDGSTPRTAAQFAFRSRWMAFSVDPVLKINPKNPQHLEAQRWALINRLSIQACKIEDFNTDLHGSRTILVAVHSHASLEAAIAAIDRCNGLLIGVVVIPCCVEQRLPTSGYQFEYTDWGVWSPKRTVKIWRPICEVLYC